MPALPTATGIRLAELAERSGAALDGNGDTLIHAVAALDAAGPGSITFLSDPKYRPQLATSRAAAVIVAPGDAPATALPKLVSPNPYATYAKVAWLLYPAPAFAPGVDPTAVVDPSASVAPDAHVGAYAVIGAGTTIDARAVVGPACVLGEAVELGEDVRLAASVTVYSRCRIGARTIVQAGAVIGADGFGMAESDGCWIKIPQVGRVVIGADCEVGANTTIDRGAIGDTVIEDDVKLDNQIQIGHNCTIGRHTAIAGCVGIAGSTRIGRNCKIGGGVGISGHLRIADGVTIGGGSKVIASIGEPGLYVAVFPLLPYRAWQHVAVQTRRLRELAERVRVLERALKSSRPEPR